MSGDASAEVLRQRELLRLARRGAGARPVARPPSREDSGRAPLSHAQHRMWLMDRLGRGGALYNVPFATRVRGPFDDAAFETALTGLVRRHAVLRTRYGGHDGEPYQEAVPAGRVPVETVEAAGDAARRLLEAEAARPFDLATGPVLRALVVRHAPDDHTILLTFHHITVDGASLEVIARELDEGYRAALDGGGPGPERDAASYAEFARRERAGAPALEEGLAYWTRRLAHARPVPLPGAAPGARGRGEGSVVRLPLAPGTLDGLRATGRAHRATLFTVVLAGAFAVLLAETGERDLVIGCASSHRDRAGARDLVGLCVNTLPIRPDLSGVEDFTGLLSRVRETLLEAQRHRDVPFDLMVRRLGAGARDGGGNALVAVTADVLGRPPVLRPAGTECEPVDVPLGTAKFALGFCLEEDAEGGGAHCVVHHDRGLLGEETARGLAHRFAGLLEAVAKDPAQPLSFGGRGAEATVPAGGAAPGALGAAVPAVRDVFGELLGERPAPDGDFFLLGGHSLLAVRVADRLRERLRVPVTGLDVLEHRTPRALGALLDGRARQRSARRACAVPAGSARPGTVLVTGGTGGVGAFVLRELAARGRPVRALVRPESAHLVAADGVEVVEGDLADADGLRAAAGGVDHVIHAACTFTSPDVDVAAMRALLAGWRRGSFVFVSSVDAYGRPETAEVCEDTPPREPLTGYGRGKLVCERLLWEAAGTSGRGGASVVRAPLVWGPHPRLRDQLRWGATGEVFQAAKAGEPVVLPRAGAVPDSGEEWSGVPWVHAAALARVLVACAERPERRTVNAVGGHVAWADFAAELIRLLGSPSEVRPPADTDPGLLHRHRYRASALTGELAERPGEDWRSVVAAMLEV
ncbi:hypothetical protein BLA24_04560 [Streptomyces cinnamoneus]|uniref:Carrier domain-containing protein n=1 Tax=Streptomyces cinnamoneus TaxID=53446 RepID=A0A2G1XNQ7_STRCJ|nr:condensation domain-containing protein [Streptomyces cinnamoneus]PHQ52850.1 hypothetical protein BLA24_04560 [Streptomyces cinnamoneus]PPT11493.1 non-ribosomal peptide synthetase/polyketide synthase [Streptomyces cinnamoneus]